MLTIHDAGARLCDGVTRREWLRAGSLGVLGLSLPALLQSRQAFAAPANAAQAFGKAKSCIVLFLMGGPPQHETWDPKPEAPVEIRGDLKPISSSVPGLAVGELMPRVARLADKCCVLRAVSTNDNAHSSSGYWMLTGYPHQPTNVENATPGAPNDWPCLGAMVRRLRPGNGMLPASVTLPEHIWNTGGITWPGQNAGFLGRTADPWLMMCDPSAPDFQVPELGLATEVPPLRLQERRSLLQQVNTHLDTLDRSSALSRYDNQTRQVFDLLRSPRARKAFNLQLEPATVRERYGM